MFCYNSSWFLSQFWVLSGKNIVFTIPIKLIPEFWRKQEIPEKFWNRYKEVKLDFLFVLDFTFNSWILGKNIVFTMTIKLIPEFLRKQEIPEKFWKRYEEVKPDFLFIPDFTFNSRILPSRAPTNHPTILLDILCLANLNRILFFIKISWFFV